MQDPDRSLTRHSRLRESAARWGWTSTLFDAVMAAAHRYLGIHVYVVRFRRIPAVPAYPETNPELQFRIIENDELLKYCDDPDLELGRPFVEKAILRGDLAFGAFDGPQLVSYIWRSVDSAPDAEGVWIKVAKPYNYSYKSFTRPAYRGQRISPVVHLFSDDEMRKRGYEYRAGFVAVSNRASLEMGKHMGSVVLGYAGYFTAFGRLLTFRTKQVKLIGFEFFRPTDPAT